MSFALLVALGGGFALGKWSPPAPAMGSDSGYYAVYTTNNVVFYAKVEGLGSAYPVLTDVFYVRSSVNQETKEVASSLIRRGNEWHAPDRMVLNAEHILFVEPVGTLSRVSALIKEMKGSK